MVRVVAGKIVRRRPHAAQTVARSQCRDVLPSHGNRLQSDLPYPLTSLKEMIAQPGYKIGFDVGISDNDGTTYRKNQHIWAGFNQNQSWWDMGMIGALIFGGKTRIEKGWRTFTSIGVWAVDLTYHLSDSRTRRKLIEG